LEQRVANLEEVTTNLKQQFELRKKHLQNYLEEITNPKQRQAVLSAVVRLNYSVQSLQQLF
jgi:stage III sporulation protein SpoIIIAA